MSVEKNWNIDQGMSFDFVLEYTDNLNAPIDITGCTAKLQARDISSSQKLSFTLSVGDGITVDGPNGKLTVHATPAKTKELPFPKSEYDLVLTDTNGNKEKLLKGFLALSRTVTV
jgi:hypothetical protein